MNLRDQIHKLWSINLQEEGKTEMICILQELLDKIEALETKVEKYEANR